MLILIFNRRTSDAQSLKDLYTINPVTLVKDRLSDLIESSIQNYQYTEEEKEIITHFIQVQLRRAGVMPPLEHIVSFLIEIDRHLVDNKPLANAIAYSLPCLHLFRCNRLATVLNNTQSTVRLLRDISSAARLGTEIIEEAKERNYLSNLEKASFSDDSSFGGLSAEEKRNFLRDFITGKFFDASTKRKEVFQIDWEEVQQVIRPRKKKISDDQIIRELEAVKQEQSGDEDNLNELIKQLQSNTEIDSELVERVLKEIGESLSGEVRAALRKMLRPRVTKNADFLNGLMHALIDLQDIHRESNCRILVEFQESDKLSNRYSRELIDAARTFQHLYGGIEQVITSVTWKLDRLWSIARSENTDDEDGEDEDEETKREIREELQFQILIHNGQGRQVGTATLIWEYRAGNAFALTAKALEHEFNFMQGKDPRIPVYYAQYSSTRLFNIDLLHPLETLGYWYQEAANLLDSIRQHQLNIPERVIISLNFLAEAWKEFIEKTRTGLLSCQADTLIKAYQQLLAEMLTYLTKSSHRRVYHTINRAWMIQEKDDNREKNAHSWVIMPLLHPIKLDWWQQRARFFNDLIQRMFHNEPISTAVDYKIIQREISTVYSSSNTPPAVTYRDDKGRTSWLVAKEEAHGYELFINLQNHDEITSPDYQQIADDEYSSIADHVIDILVQIIRDYIEIYPFVQDGIRVLLLECNNSSIPVMLLKRMSAMKTANEEPYRFHLIVHTSRHGANIFQQIDKWVENEFSQQDETSYFPYITFEVQECPIDDLLQSYVQANIVLLVDLFTRNAKSLRHKLERFDNRLEEPAWPIIPMRPVPLEEGETYRHFWLTPHKKMPVLRLFLLAQYAGLGEIDTWPVDIHLYYEQSLEQWQNLLEQLHSRFHWVVCYDQVVDRFLLQATCNNAQIIRYALGLGKQRLYHLTVSSSGSTQQIVVQRLANRLRDMLPQVNDQHLRDIATKLASKANCVSGDIVLRAAGPGAFLNELIGIVATILRTEQLFQQQHSQAIPIWISLDSFRHWFPTGKTGRIPDLLFIGLANENGQCTVHLQIIEAKCVNSSALQREAHDAQIQVRTGVSRLANAFAPGMKYLDAPYWYDQLYRAIAGNLVISDEQIPIWELARDRLPQGDFKLVASGHSWVFCYDDEISDPDLSEKPFSVPASEAPDVPLIEHLCGRNALFKILGGLTEATITIDQPLKPSAKTEDYLSEETLLPADDLFAIPQNQQPLYELPQTLPLMVAESSDTSIEAKNETLPVSSIPELVQTPRQHSATDTSYSHGTIDQDWLNHKADEIEQKLRRRGVQLYAINGKDADVGPSIVRFKFRLKPNEQLKRLKSMIEDLARDLKLERPPFIDNVPGTDFVGIDIPRDKREVIHLQPLLPNIPIPGPAELPVIIGISPEGKLVIEDLAEFPHLLVAGTTKSGKSVFLRNLLISLLSVYRAGQIELLIIDPKQTDFAHFANVPFLRKNKVIVERKEAREALLELVHEEMPRRQRHIAHRSMKIKTFNQRYPSEALSPIVAVIDEYGLLTSLMEKKDREAFEQDLSTLAAAARSVGIHLVLATQHPSATVITPTIKANLDARVALRVASPIYSRVVLDMQGAEHLLGHGDMLFRRSDGSILRLQAPFLDEEEIPALLQSLNARF